MGARLRLVSADGRLGLVSTLMRRLWLLDILARRRLEDASFSYRWSGNMSYVGGLSSAGELLWPRTFSGGGTPFSTLLQPLALRVSSVGLVDEPLYLEPAIASGRFDRSEQALIGKSVDERVLIYPLPGRRLPPEPAEVVEPLQRRAVQAFDGDLTTGIVAAATHGELGVVRIGERPFTKVELEPEDAIWVGVARDRVAVVGGSRQFLNTAFDEVHRLNVFRVEGRELVSMYSATHRGKASMQGPAVADISDNGRFVAIALQSKEIAVHDIEGRGVQRLSGHTDRISTIRFGPGGSFLVSGDFDNRVIVRFRGADGFVERLEKFPLLGE